MSEGLTEQPWTSGPRPRSVEEEMQSPGAEGRARVENEEFIEMFDVSLVSTTADA